MEATNLSWVDWALLGVLTVSVLVGAWRGLVFEVLSLLGWVAAYIAAQAFSPMLAPHLPLGSPGTALNQGAAFALVFIGALIVWGLASKLIQLLIQATPLSVIDRVLGAGFGLLRGGVLLLALATVLALTPAARSPAWRDSQGATWINAMLHELRPVLPDEVSRHLPA